jgi:hypothetical protein
MGESGPDPGERRATNDAMLEWKGAVSEFSTDEEGRRSTTEMHLVLTDEQVEAAHAEMEADLASRLAQTSPETKAELNYEDQLAEVAGALRTRRKEQLEARQREIEEQFPAAALASRNLWEDNREFMRRHASMEMINFVAGHRQEIWEKSRTEQGLDDIDTVWSRVLIDVGDTLNPNILRAGPNAADFAAGRELLGLADPDTLSAEDLTRVTEAVQLLVAYGEQKLFTLGVTGQLREAVRVIERFAERVPYFDPESAGLSRLSAELDTAAALLTVDLKTKPNLKHADPARALRLEHINEISAMLDKVQAHVFLRRT